VAIVTNPAAHDQYPSSTLSRHRRRRFRCLDDGTSGLDFVGDGGQEMMRVKQITVRSSVHSPTAIRASGLSMSARLSASTSSAVNEPFLATGGSAEQFRAGIDRAVALGWLLRHESGTYGKFTDSGAALFA
jgi:hypothetical protein